MHLPGTVLFVDLAGSTALFAMAAAGALQCQHLQGSTPWPLQQGVGLRVGVASGSVVQLDGDIYGDAVNVAARLCERAGIGEIWTTDTTAVDAGAVPGIRFRALGNFDIRGKSEPLPVYLAEWDPESAPESLTLQATFSAMAQLDAQNDRCIQLSWQGQSYRFTPSDMPRHVGRSADADICLDDARVSRLHIRLDWRSGGCLLTDLSSYGTWLRFDGSATELRLHRESCWLHGTGQVALGMRLAGQAPILGFTVGGCSPRSSRAGS